MIMTYIVMAYIVMAHTVMAYVVTERLAAQILASCVDAVQRPPPSLTPSFPSSRAGSKQTSVALAGGVALNVRLNIRLLQVVDECVDIPYRHRSPVITLSVGAAINHRKTPRSRPVQTPRSRPVKTSTRHACARALDMPNGDTNIEPAAMCHHSAGSVGLCGQPSVRLLLLVGRMSIASRSNQQWPCAWVPWALHLGAGLPSEALRLGALGLALGCGPT